MNGNERRLTPVTGWIFSIVLLLVIVRVTPLGAPMVFADESLYAAVSASKWFGAAHLDWVAKLENWLFITIFSVVHGTDADPLQFARLLNAVFAALASVAVVILTRSGMGKMSSAALAVSTGAFFVGGMAAYFMPETLYYCLTVVSFASLFRYFEERSAVSVVVIAFSLCCATLAKSHGALLVPGFLGTMLLAGWRIPGRDLPTCVRDCLLLASTYMAAFVSLKYLLSGTWGFNPLGDFYTDVGKSSMGETLLKWESYALVGKHLSVMALLAGPYLLLCVLGAARFAIGEKSGQSVALAATCFVAVGTCIGMLMLTVAFTVHTAGSGGYESLSRLHGRYYEHLLCICAVLGVVASHGLASSLSNKQRLFLSMASLTIIWACFSTANGIGWQNPNDFSIAFALGSKSYAALVAAVLVSSVSIAIFVKPRWIQPVSVIAFGGWLIFNSITIEKLRWSLADQPADIVGKAISLIERTDDTRDRVEIISSSPSADVYRAAFWLAGEDVHVGTVPSAGCIRPAASTEWIVLLTDVARPCSGSKFLEVNGAVAWKMR